MITPTPFTLSPFSPENIVYMGLKFPFLISFIFFFLFPLFMFIHGRMNPTRAMLIASIIGYFMYIGFTIVLPVFYELFKILKSPVLDKVALISWYEKNQPNDRHM